MTRTTCGACRGAGWIWVHAKDPKGVIRVAEASCGACGGRGAFG
jgi:hypothetical protein